MIAIAVIIPCLFVAAKVMYDYKQWLKKRNQVNTKSITNHALEFGVAVVVNAPAIILFAKQSAMSFWLAVVLSGAMTAFFIWLFFDGFYNVLRGFGWWFTGSGELTAANTDKFLKRLPVWLHVTIKVGGLAGMILLYILNLKR